MDNVPAVTLQAIGRLDLLKQSPYFTGLSAVELEQIDALAIEERYDRGTLIFSEGDEDHRLYLVASGAVKIFGTSAEGKEQIMALSRPGDSFNDVAAFDDEATQTAAQALTPVILFSLNGRELLNQSCRLGRMAANIVRALAGRVRQLGDLVADLSFRPVVGRLAKILLEQQESHSLYLTQRDIAAMIGTAREVVARALKALEDQGYISVERQKIVILNYDALKEMVP